MAELENTLPLLGLLFQNNSFHCTVMVTVSVVVPSTSLLSTSFYQSCQSPNTVTTQERYVLWVVHVMSPTIKKFCFKVSPLALGSLGPHPCFYLLLST